MGIRGVRERSFKLLGEAWGRRALTCWYIGMGLCRHEMVVGIRPLEKAGGSTGGDLQSYSLGCVSFELLLGGMRLALKARAGWAVT